MSIDGVSCEDCKFTFQADFNSDINLLLEKINRNKLQTKINSLLFKIETKMYSNQQIELQRKDFVKKGNSMELSFTEFNTRKTGFYKEWY